MFRRARSRLQRAPHVSHGNGRTPSDGTGTRCSTRSTCDRYGSRDSSPKVFFINKAQMDEILAKVTGIDKGARDDYPDVPAFTLPAGSKGVAVH